MSGTVTQITHINSLNPCKDPRVGYCYHISLQVTETLRNLSKVTPQPLFSAPEKKVKIRCKKYTLEDCVYVEFKEVDSKSSTVKGCRLFLFLS